MKYAILGVALLALSAPLTAAQASEVIDGRVLEAIALDLEKLIGGLEGVDFDTLKLEEVGNGLYSVAIPLSPATRDRLLEASASAKDFQPLAVGLQLSDLDSLSTLITAVSALENASYTFWFAVVNFRDTDQVKKTTFQLKGPGEKFKIVQDITYNALTLAALVSTQSSGDFGVHTIQVKVTGGGKAKTKYLAN